MLKSRNMSTGLSKIQIPKGVLRRRVVEGRMAARGPDLGWLQRLHGFTLIELLVVVAIIALLVSILLPSLQNARELTNQVVCMNNLKSVSLSVSMYTLDNSDYFFDNREQIEDHVTHTPGSGPRWFESGGALSGYSDEVIESMVRFACPTNDENLYFDLGWSEIHRAEFFANRRIIRSSTIYGSAVKLGDIKNPAGKILITEPGTFAWSLDGFDYVHYDTPSCCLGDHHFGAINVLWADLHVSLKDNVEFRDDLTGFIYMSMIFPWF